MSAIPAIKYMTVEEYLEMEDASFEKHEFIGGEVIAMAGAGFAHNQITSNTQIDIGSFLKDKSCRIYGSDLKVHVRTEAGFVYPDLTIVCNGPQFLEGRKDIIVNPSVLIEVVSFHTENHDRGKKFMLYRQLESLQEYILISSLEMRLEKFSKVAANEWTLREYTSPEDLITIDAIGYQTTLAELYRDVVFEEIDFGRGAVRERE
jgi:Uma2 family endonuclease